MEQTAPDTLDLRGYLLVLRRRWKVIAITTLLVVIASQAVALFQTPMYQGKVQLAIEPIRGGSDASLEDLILGNDVVETERLVITSRPVSERVIAMLDLDVTPVELVEQTSVSVLANTRVVTITVTDMDPTLAAAKSDAYAAAYLDYRRDRAIEEITLARANLDKRGQELSEAIAAIDDELDGATAGGSVTPDEAALLSQRDALVAQLGQIGTTLATLDPGGNAIRGGGEVLVPAEIATTPVSPRPARSGALALVLGLMLGVGIAFLQDHFDDAIRGDDDIARVSGGRPVLGRITHWDDPRANERLITVVDPHDAASEEFQALAANIRFSLMSRQGDLRAFGAEYRKQSVLITSATAGEGKSSIAGNLAVAAAAAGMRVIMVGADLRQPTIATRFGVPPGLGLSDLLVDARQLSSPDRIADHLVDVGLPRLRILPAGTIPPNPTELLASPQMEWLHGCLTAMADLVIYDTPPLLPVADSLQIAPHVDACIIVARTTKANRRELQHAVERLDGIGADVAGFVVNDVPVGKRTAYGYGYGYRPDTYRPREEGNTPGTLGPGTPSAPGSPSPSWSSDGGTRPAPSARAEPDPVTLDSLELVDAFGSRPTVSEPTVDDLDGLDDDGLFTRRSDAGTPKS